MLAARKKKESLTAVIAKKMLARSAAKNKSPEPKCRASPNLKWTSAYFFFEVFFADFFFTVFLTGFAIFLSLSFVGTIRLQLGRSRPFVATKFSHD